MTGIFLLSLAYILGFYFFLNPPVSEAEFLLKSSPVTQKPISLTQTLSSPDDNLLIFEPDLLIQGKTAPHTIVILSTNEDDQILQSGNFGDFSASIKLDKGVNNLSTTVFDNSGTSKTEYRTIYYSTEKI